MSWLAGVLFAPQAISKAQIIVIVNLVNFIIGCSIRRCNMHSVEIISIYKTPGAASLQFQPPV